MFMKSESVDMSSCIALNCCEYRGKAPRKELCVNKRSVKVPYWMFVFFLIFWRRDRVTLMTP